MGSLFRYLRMNRYNWARRDISCSSLQFFISPYIGSLSDTYGRKQVLLISMLGNIASAIVYVLFCNLLGVTELVSLGGFSPLHSRHSY